MNELDTGKANVVTAYYLTTIAKVRQKYGREGESLASAFRRMADESVKDVRLTAESIKEIEERRQANYEKRMKAREQKKCEK